jgi:hypothetical protein
MNLFGAFFPTSYLFILVGLCIGFFVSFLMFGTVSVLLLFFLLYVGALRIKPFIDLLHKGIQYIFPNTCKAIRGNIAKSFPVKWDILPKKGIYLMHPHGLFNISQGMHIGTHFTGWPERNIKGTALHTLWNIPCTHEFLERFVPSNYENMKEVLQSNTSLSISMGGLSEITKVKEGFSLKIKDRKGAFRLAIETGTPLVPVLVYGENEVFTRMDGYFIDIVSKCFSWVGLPCILPNFHSIYKTINLIQEPYDIKVSTHIGKPIEVEYVKKATAAHITSLRNTYMKSLEELYEKTKPDGYPERIDFF